LETNEHCYNGGWDKDGNEIKYHIPSDGSVWFVNPGVKHYAVNDGPTSRNHLIISLDSQTFL
jgi:quercetin dioxygenase-like cupin family protein